MRPLRPHMHISVETLDDALLRLYTELLSRESNVAASRGPNTEMVGVLIEIERPRARLSRSETRGRLFSSLGELLWYITGDTARFHRAIHRTVSRRE